MRSQSIQTAGKSGGPALPKQREMWRRGTTSPVYAQDATAIRVKGWGRILRLADKPEADLLRALRDSKSGRSNSLMHGLAASLSDQDMEDLAAYYASLK